MLSNCGAIEVSWKSLGQQRDQRNQLWISIGRTDAEAEALILWPPNAKNWLIGKRSWCWERLKAGEGDNRGWDGWLESLTQWVWASSWRWWRTGKPGVLQSMTLQRLRHDWATEQQPTNTEGAPKGRTESCWLGAEAPPALVPAWGRQQLCGGWSDHRAPDAPHSRRAPATIQPGEGGQSCHQKLPISKNTLRMLSPDIKLYHYISV